jgi:hypothetical protein
MLPPRRRMLRLVAHGHVELAIDDSPAFRAMADGRVASAMIQVRTGIRPTE